MRRRSGNRLAVTIRVRDGCSRRRAHEAVASIRRNLRDGLGSRDDRSCAPRAHLHANRAAQLEPSHQDRIGRGPWQNVVAMLRYGDSGMIRAAGQPDDEPAALAEFRDILATGFFEPDAD